MNKLFVTKAATLALAAIAFGVSSARASFELTLTSGASSETIVDNGPLDQSSVTGAIFWKGTVGNWTVNFDLGLSKPIIGTTGQPTLDLSIISATSKTANSALSITLSDDSFTPLPQNTGFVAMSLGGTTRNASVSGSAGVNGGTSVNLGPLSTSAYNKNGIGGVSGVGSTFSMAETIVLTHNSGTSSSSTSGDFEMYVESVPEPSSIIAGALLLLPFGWTAFRKLRKTSAPQA